MRLKFNPLPEVVAGKRLVVVDDSIVRGNTTAQLSLIHIFAEHIQLQIVGSVSGNQLTIVAGEARIELSLELLREAHGALGALFD